MTARTARRAARPRVVLAAAVAVVALGALNTSGRAPASAAGAGAGSATAQAAQSTQGSGLAITQNVSLLPTLPLGLGLTLSQLTSKLTSVVISPLTSALTALPGQLAGGLVGVLTGSGLQATSPAGQQQRPASGLPTCGQQGWTSDDCYGPVVPAVSAAPVLTLSNGALQGYATGDADGYVAAAQSAHPQLSLLGITLGDLGLIGASARCGNTTTASCSATQSLTGTSLLDGHLTLSLAEGGALIAKVDGLAVPAAGTTIPALGTSTVVTLNGNLATLKITLSLDQLLTALGLPSLLSSLATIGPLADAGSSITLTVTIGPGSVSAGSPAAAWGLDVTADLSADVKLTLATTGLLATTLASIELRTGGSSTPDLLDLLLAYATATAGAPPPGWVPPALI